MCTPAEKRVRRQSRARLGELMHTRRDCTSARSASSAPAATGRPAIGTVFYARSWGYRKGARDRLGACGSKRRCSGWEKIGKNSRSVPFPQCFVCFRRKVYGSGNIVLSASRELGTSLLLHNSYSSALHIFDRDKKAWPLNYIDQRAFFKH